MRYIISILFWIYFALTLAIVFPFALVLWLLTFWDSQRNISHRFSAAWSKLYSGFNPYWSITVSNRDKVDRHKTYVIVANHNSFIDILVLYRSGLDFKWVAKDVLFKAPFLGWNMQLSGYIKIKRGDEKSRKILFDTCKKWISKKVSVLFFPEGTRSKDGLLQNFKPGAFILAVEMNTPILPLLITGTRDALPARSMIFSHKANMNLKFLDEIHPQDISESDPNVKVAKLIELTRQKMLEALEASGQKSYS
jgi:1-acyl-sn-glycerol-3-phosphate acyltransferase